MAQIEKLPDDLFQTTDALPPTVRAVADHYTNAIEQDEVNGYRLCAAFLKEMEALFYTFDYGLDGVPFDLRQANPSNTPEQTVDLELDEESTPGPQ